MPAVIINNLVKRFDKSVAVEDLSLEVSDGEIVTLLGPSGCGKTTTLRCIAGFLLPDGGEIYLGDKEVSREPPERREIGFVFQNYALWPHMTVFQNLAFGLQLRKVPTSEIKRRVEETLSLVRLSGFAERYPRQLSGGQQQRVALARALVIEPRVLLLDEPLSNLDAQLREDMRFEIRELQKNLGITTLYVTHDQAEALVLSDRIAVLNEGRLQQVGTPEEIYNRPNNRFIAGFIGLSSFVDGMVADVHHNGRYATVQTPDGLTINVPAEGLAPDRPITLAIRPEHISLALSPPEHATPGTNLLEGTVVRRAYLGDVVDYRVQVGSWQLRVHTETDIKLGLGDKVWLTLPPDQVTLIGG